MSGLQRPERFVLRWGEEEEWGHLAVVAGDRKPRWLGFVRLEGDAAFRELAKSALVCGEMREVWLARHRRKET
jgi:hypothetical protein